MILDPMGFIGSLWPQRGPQLAGPIRRGRRSSLGRRWRNRETVPPPPAKAARIEAGRAKLVAKAKRSAERSRRDREGSR